MLEGDLTDFTLPDVLRLLAATGKTGRLTVGSDGTNGRIDLRDGRVRDVSCDTGQLAFARRLLGIGALSADAVRQLLDGRDTLPSDLEFAGALVAAGHATADALAPPFVAHVTDAAFDLLRWSDGSFRFVGVPAAGPADPLEASLAVDALLTEVAERLESWPDLLERSGARDAVVTIARPDPAGAGAADVAIGADGWALLALIDGRRDVAELAALWGQGEHAARRTLAQLRDAGVVTVGEAEQAGPLERLLAGHTELAGLERDLRPAVPGASPSVATALDASPDPALVAPSEPDASPSAASPVPPAPAVRPAPAAAAPSAPVAPPPAPRPVRALRGPRPATAPAAPPAASREAAPTTVFGTSQVRPLRTTVRRDRLRTDPTVDTELLDRLIDGVEAL